MRSRFYRLTRWIVIALPAFLFFCGLLPPFIPGAMGITDGAGPWYQGLTSKLFLAGLIFASPVTFFCPTLLRDDLFLSPIHFGVLAVYAALWMFFLRLLFRFFERHAAKSA